MRTSDRGLRFIAKWEGLVNQLYNDDWKPLATSQGNCTIGVGHLVHIGPCNYVDQREVPFFNGITDEQAIELMRDDVPRYEAVVNAYVTVTVNQNQYDALVDFCFNTGGGYRAVWNAVNGGGDVCDVLVRTAILPAWATAALVRRRQAECALYMEPYEEEHMPTPEFDDLTRKIDALTVEFARFAADIGLRVDNKDPQKPGLKQDIQATFALALRNQNRVEALENRT